MNLRNREKPDYEDVEADPLSEKLVGMMNRSWKWV
jgi:hypothetical protein